MMNQNSKPDITWKIEQITLHQNFCDNHMTFGFFFRTHPRFAREYSMRVWFVSKRVNIKSVRSIYLITRQSHDFDFLNKNF